MPSKVSLKKNMENYIGPQNAQLVNVHYVFLKTNRNVNCAKTERHYYQSCSKYYPLKEHFTENKKQ